MVAMFRGISDALAIQCRRSPPESRTRRAMIADVRQGGSSCSAEARARARMQAPVDKPRGAWRDKFDIENYFDDCGDFIAGLGMGSGVFVTYEECDAYSDDDNLVFLTRE
eukprot:8053043-Pyramimonas_sp.AAC.1